MAISPEILAQAAFFREPAAELQPTPRKLSLSEMAEKIAGLALGCQTLERKWAGNTYAFISAQDACDLEQIASALEMMAPYAGAIRRLIQRGEQ